MTLVEDRVSVRAPRQYLTPPQVAQDDVLAGPITVSEVLVDALFHDLTDAFPIPIVTANASVGSAKVNDDTVFYAGGGAGIAWMLPSLHLDQEQTPTIVLANLNTVQPAAYLDGDQGYGAQLDLFVFSSPLDDADEQIIGASLIAGAVGLGPASVHDGDVFTPPTFAGTYVLTAASVSSDESINAPAVALMIQYLSPSAHIDQEDTLDPDGVTTVGKLLADMAVTDVDVVAAPIVLPGAVALSPMAFGEPDIGYPVVLQTQVWIIASFVADDDVVGPLSAAPGDAHIIPGLIPDDGMLWSNALVPGPVGVQPEWFGDTDVLSSSIAAAGPANLGAFPHQDSDLVRAPTIVEGIGMGRINDVDRFFGPQLTGGVQQQPVSVFRLNGSMSGPGYMVGGVKTHRLNGSTRTAA